MATVEPQTHTIICIDALELRPNKFRHLGAELEAGEHLKAKGWEYFASSIKAVVVPYVVRKDFTKGPPEMTAAVAALKADAEAFVKSVAKCDIHPEDWDVWIRGTDVMDNRCWIQPSRTWAHGTLKPSKDD